jgi:hypothetical protein
MPVQILILQAVQSCTTVPEPPIPVVPCPQFGDDFTAYIVFLSQLISIPEDVTLLAQRQIIVHHLDSDDLFTLLSKDVVFDFNGNYYLKFLCQTMETHYQSRINRWMALLENNANQDRTRDTDFT